MQYTYTIIIPHFETPLLLKRLLKSMSDLYERADDSTITAQIIVVDDCSGPETQNELTQIKEQFPSVEFYSTDSNGGGGKARNVGLQKAKGKLVLFADADDFFLPNLKEVLERHQNTSADIVFCNAISLESDTLLPSFRVNHLQNNIRLYEKNDPMGELCLRYLFGEPWCKIVRRSLIEDNNIRFEEIKSHNDTLFSYSIGYAARTIEVEGSAIYCLTRRSISVSTDHYDGRLENRVRVFATKNKFFLDHQIPLFDEILLWPFINAYKNRRRREFKHLLNVANSCGLKKSFILKKLASHFLRKKLHLKF